MRSDTVVLPLAQQAARAAAALVDAVELVTEAARVGAFAAAPAVVQPALAISLLRSADRVRAAATVATGAVHESGWLPDGQVSLGRWLEDAAGLSGREAGSVIAQARSLGSDYSATGDAWLTGEISGAMASTLSQSIDRILRQVPAEQRDEQRPALEARLLEPATQVTPDRMSRVIKDIRAYVDPDGARQAEIDAFDEQKLSFTPIGAGVVVNGWLAHETYAQIRTALDQVVDGWHRCGELPAEDRVDVTDAGAERRKRLRQPHLHALALAQICTDATESGSLGRHHGLVPRITITASLDLLTRGMGGELLLPGHDNPAAVIPDGVRRMMCDAEVTAILESGHAGGDEIDLLLKEASAPFLYVGRAHRVVTPRLRRALEHRDRHCAFPGCRVNVRRTRAHHVVFWEAGGTTGADNCVLLCERHHHSVHEGGWTVRASGHDPRAHGYWSFVPPDALARP